jgi:hypothetical protein
LLAESKSEKEREKVLNERIGKLLDRRNRAVSNTMRGIADGERAVTEEDISEFIRETRTEMSCARTKITNSRASRDDRESERERQHIEEMQRIREAELRKRGEEQRERERMYEESKKRRNRSWER